ncbi:MAG: glycogen-binding domain-containing protein [Candidatus Krumholzibacteriia bacterium]
MRTPSHPSRPLSRVAGLLSRAAWLGVLLITGCSYMNVLRDRLPTPHRVDDFENAVLFQYEAPQAKHVNVCGNWEENTWCGTEGTGRFDHAIGAMHDDDGDGVWEIVIPLKPGRYQYKYSIDWGLRWEHDPNNPLTDSDGFGGSNSILILR